jgi:hypothetical protein
MLRVLFLSIALGTIFVGCYEEQEGCLDPLAVNYDVSADINADCEYPALSFSVDHRWGDEIFSTDSFYLDAAGDSIQILFFGVFVRNLEVDTGLRWVALNSNQRSWTLNDNSTIESSAPIGFIQARNFETDWGQLDYFGAFDSVRLQIGLGLLEEVDPNLIEEDHPLNRAIQMYDTTEQKFSGWVLRYRRDTASSAPIVQVSSAETQLIPWSQEASGSIQRAENKSFIFELNYERLFRDFNGSFLPVENQAAINESWSEAFILRDP